MELGKLGVSFDAYHTRRDFGLRWLDMDITGARAKTAMIEIPGRRTPIDASEAAYGGLTYSNRKITLKFVRPHTPPYAFQPYDSKIENFISGQRMKVILDTEPDCYWIGRASVQSEINAGAYGIMSVTVTIEAEPYRHWSGDLWPWDSFSFVDGIVPMQKAEVSGSKTLKLPAMYRPGTPKVLSDAAMAITCGEKSWTTEANKAFEIPLEVFKEDVTLSITGTGTISIVLSGETL